MTKRKEAMKVRGETARLAYDIYIAVTSPAPLI
jgi:hypothetical protein